MIRAVACYHGIKRKKDYAPSGNPLIDDIRAIGRAIKARGGNIDVEWEPLEKGCHTREGKIQWRRLAGSRTRISNAL